MSAHHIATCEASHTTKPYTHTLNPNCPHVLQSGLTQLMAYVKCVSPMTMIHAHVLFNTRTEALLRTVCWLYWRWQIHYFVARTFRNWYEIV